MMITYLPKTDEIRVMSAEDVAQRVIELCEAGNRIQGDAVMDVNRFMADAALKLARATPRPNAIQNTGTTQF